MVALTYKTLLTRAPISSVFDEMSRYDATRKIWFGPDQPPLFNPAVSVGQILLNILDRTPDKVTQIDGDTGREMTCGEFRARTVRIVQNLAARGVTKGDQVVLACGNSENVFPLMVALLTIGVKLVIFPVYYDLQKLKYFGGKFHPTVVFCDDENRENLAMVFQKSSGRKVAFYLMDGWQAEELLEQTGREDSFVAPYLGDSRATLAVILCTSGTTGLPKGVQLSHAQIIAWGLSYFQINQGIHFRFSPLSWATGFVFVYSLIANSTPRLFTRHSFNEDVFFDLLEKYPISSVGLQPSYSKSVLCHPRCRTADFSSIRIWKLFGSLPSDLLRDQIEALLPNGRTVNEYGLSEAGRVATDEMGRKPASSGQLVPRLQARLVDQAGNAVGVGELGDLQVKKEEPFLGYLDEPEAMAELITDDGWLRTEDCGYFDEEHYFYMGERRKFTVCYRNQLIIPSTVEWVIERVEGVRHACVIGVPEKDCEASELLTAVVVKEKQCYLQEEQLEAMVNEQLPERKKLRGGLMFREALPLGMTGKILRDKVRQLVLEEKQV